MEDAGALVVAKDAAQQLLTQLDAAAAEAVAARQEYGVLQGQLELARAEAQALKSAAEVSWSFCPSWDSCF